MAFGFIAFFLAGPTSVIAQTDPEVRILSASIEMRKVVGKRTIRVTQGDRVQLNWQTDEKVELHLHGIDQKTVVLPGAGARWAEENWLQYPGGHRGGLLLAAPLRLAAHPRAVAVLLELDALGVRRLQVIDLLLQLRAPLLGGFLGGFPPLLPEAQEIYARMGNRLLKRANLDGHFRFICSSDLHGFNWGLDAVVC